MPGLDLTRRDCRDEPRRALTASPIPGVPLQAQTSVACQAEPVHALASHTWYVDGVQGNDNNDCRSRQHACKTISNAIFLTVAGDSIRVAPAVYHEGIFIPF